MKLGKDGKSVVLSNGRILKFENRHKARQYLRQEAKTLVGHLTGKSRMSRAMIPDIDTSRTPNAPKSVKTRFSNASSHDYDFAVEGKLRGIDTGVLRPRKSWNESPRLKGVTRRADGSAMPDSYVKDGRLVLNPYDEKTVEFNKQRTQSLLQRMEAERDAWLKSRKSRL